MAKKKAASPLPKLTESEEDLLSQMQHGYELETDSLGADPILRQLKDNEVIRPLTANRGTIEASDPRREANPQLAYFAANSTQAWPSQQERTPPRRRTSTAT